MSGQEEDNPKETEGGSSRTSFIHRNCCRIEKRKGSKENCLYKGEEVFIDYNSEGRC